VLAKVLDISPAIPLQIGESAWQCFCVRDRRDDEGHTSAEHLVLVHAPAIDIRTLDQELFAEEDNVLVRIHSECLFGDVFGSDRCDCGIQLQFALNAISEAKRGVIIYLRQEGRGIGLYNKILSLGVRDADTFARNEALGLPGDKRQYSLAVHVLLGLGVHSARLISGNPHKASALRAAGIDTTIAPSTDMGNISQDAYDELCTKINNGYTYDV
jgi:GTP cyclohydrolase II